MKGLVVLPTYNERENIERIVAALLRADDDLQVAIVDDHSPDGTGQVADDLARQCSGRVHVIHRNGRGRGTAGITGFRYALTQHVDCIMEMDADFSHDPKYIPQFLKEIECCDVLIGSRFMKGGKSIRNPSRKLISIGANLYTRLILGRDIKDWCGGYKCYRKEALASLDFSGFYSKGYSIGMETLCRLKRAGFNYKEIPITFIDKRRKGSKFSMKEVVTYMLLVLKLKWRSNGN